MKKRNYNYKVKRENGSYDEVEFCFRIINLNSDKLINISKRLTDYDVKLPDKIKTKGNVVLIENLSSKFNAQKIKNLMKEYEIKEKNYGIWISFTSDYGHCGLSVPYEISKIHKEVGGTLDIYIIILGSI